MIKKSTMIKSIMIIFHLSVVSSKKNVTFNGSNFISSLTILYKSLWKRTCFDQLALHLHWFEKIVKGMKLVSDINQKHKFVCPMNFDKIAATVMFPTDSSEEKLPVVDDFNLHCTLEKYWVCDGFSHCLTDECACDKDDNEVFYCIDGSGCLSLNLLCDGVRSCKDGSDESLCEGFLSLNCTDEGLVFVSKENYCDGKKMFNKSCDTTSFELDCALHERPRLEKRPKLNPISRCFHKAYNRGVDMKSLERDINRLNSFCLDNCSLSDDWKRFCGKLIPGMYDANFVCDDSLENAQEGDIDSTHHTKLCDEIVDCKQGSDEIGCPGRFYCHTHAHTEYVSPTKVCDKIKDCSNGFDECQDSCFDGLLLSSKILVSSPLLFLITIPLGFAIIILNCIIGYKCFNNRPTSNAARINRIMCLQVFSYDSLMGVYLCALVIITIVFANRGNYCSINDKVWRSSVGCTALGVLFSTSSHGSLMTIVFMSIIRCLVCTRVLLHVSQKKILIVSGLLLIVNLGIAVIPIIPHDTIQSIFRTDFFLLNHDKNPFISSIGVDKGRLDEVHMKVFGNKTDLKSTIRDLNKITSSNDMFDIIDTGYYGNTPMCIHNIFKTNEMYFRFKVIYLTCLGVMLLTFSSTYIKIIHHKIVSRKKVRCIAKEGNMKKDSSKDVKIFLMIGSQLISWCLFIGTAIIFEARMEPPHPIAFEVFALFVLPINSFLNPLFYSNLYNKLTSKIKQFRARRKMRKIAENNQNDDKGKKFEMESGLTPKMNMGLTPNQRNHQVSNGEGVIVETALL